MTRSRPSVFVGSSTEGLEIAKALQVLLDDACEMVIWSQGVFGLSQGRLESLVHALDQFDFAVLVLTADDLVISRESSSSAPRDNVLFELGLFMGSLGRKRTFILYDRTAGLKLPSDLAGVTPATFERHNSGNLRSALGAAATRIEEQVRRLGAVETSLGEVTAPFLRSRDQARIFYEKPVEYFREIFIAGPTLMVVASMPDFFGKVVRHGGNVRFLIPNPDRESPATLGLISHWHTDGFLDEVKAALKNFRSFKRTIAPNAAGSFEVRYRDCAATLSLLMVNGESEDGYIHVELLPFNTANSGRPHFVLNPQTDKEWYEFFRMRCNDMWKSEKRDDIPPHVGPSHPLDIESFDIEALKHCKKMEGVA